MNPEILLSISICLVFISSANHGQPLDVPEADMVSSVHWSHDGQQVILTYQGGGIDVYNVGTQLIETQITSDVTGPILDAALQPGDDVLATVDGRENTTLWDLTVGSQIARYSQPTAGAVWRIAWSPDSEYFITGNASDSSVRDRGGQTLFTIPSEGESIPSVAISADGRIAMSFAAKIEIWDIPSQTMRLRERTPGLRYSIQWNREGSLLLAANTRILAGERFFEVVVLDALTGMIVRRYEGFPAQLTDAQWSPDETQILTTSEDGEVRLTDNLSGETQTIFSANSPIFTADWSPYGGRVAIGVSTEASLALQSAEISGSTTEGTSVPILVPDPSVERLQAIAQACTAVPIAEMNAQSVDSALDGPLESLNMQADAAPTAEAQAVEAFIAQVEALPDDMLPPGCEADLLAVAEAIAVQ